MQATVHSHTTVTFRQHVLRPHTVVCVCDSRERWCTQLYISQLYLLKFHTGPRRRVPPCSRSAMAERFHELLVPRGGAQEETARDTAESDDEMTKWAAALGVVLAAEAPVARAGDDNGGDALRREKPASPQQEQVAAPAPLVDNEVVPAAIASQVIAALVVTEARPLRKLRATGNRSAAVEPSAAARSILPQTSTAVARAPTPPSVPLTTNIPASA